MSGSVLLAAGLVCPVATAAGAEPEMTMSSAAQLYAVRSPTGGTVIARRRMTTTLGVSIYDLYDRPTDPSAPSLSLRARLRYDGDYGGAAGETDPANPSRLVPGFDRAPIDLMYGYLEGRRFLGGYLGFKLGRQYVVDALGWWSFDGGEVKVTTPFFVAAELYGGLEQRGGLALSTPRFEREGVWRGDRTGYDPSLYPSFQPSAIAPAYGAALETSGLSWLRARVSYRRVDNTATSNATELANGVRPTLSYGPTRVSSERVGLGFDATLSDLGGLKSGFAYDLYAARLASLYASADAFASRTLTLSLDYDYFVPTFDADSIWNFFLAMPRSDLGLRASWEATEHLSLAGGARARAFTVQTNNEAADSSPNGLATASYFPSSSLDLMGGGDLAARWRFGEGAFGARGNADFADNGERLGVDFYGERTLETRYVLSARAGVWQWDDKLRPDRDAVSFQYVAGVGYKLPPRSLVYVDFEHDMNRIAGQRFRGMLWLSLAVSR